MLYCAPSVATIKNWFNDFQRRRKSISIEPIDLVLADHRPLTVREIAEAVNISKDRVGLILHEMLGMRKLLARWVACSFHLDSICNRETIS